MATNKTKSATAKERAAKQTTPSRDDAQRVIIEIHVFTHDAASSIRMRGAEKGEPSPSFALPAAVDEARDVDTAVRKIILKTVGDSNTDPGSLPDTASLEMDLGYTDELKEYLHIGLHNYVSRANPQSGVTSKEMAACETVGDCVDLVKAKIETT